MTCLSTDDLSPALREKISPFFHEILENSAPQIHSIYLVGSVLTEDYQEKTSKIDSVIVLKKMDLAFLDVLAPLGNKYGKKGLAPRVFAQFNALIVPRTMLSNRRAELWAVKFGGSRPVGAFLQ